MSKHARTVIGYMMILTLLSGCGYAARSYVVVRERVDQEDYGNAGYLQGEQSAEQAQEIKKTRKVYVMEFTEVRPDDLGEPAYPTDPKPAKDLQQMESPKPVDLKEKRLMAPEPKTETKKVIILPDFDTYDDSAPDAPAASVNQPQAPAPASAGTGGFVEYTIQKDDTLQKISKKFYGSYSKWPKIYDANKSVIKDPNRIKPGVVLKIPQ